MDLPILDGTATNEQLAAGVLMVGFPSMHVPPETEALIAAGVRNFILFARNTGRPAQVRAVTAELQRLTAGSAIIGIDHEGGRVNRLRGAATAWPSPMAWAATGDLALARRASAVAAHELRSLGITLNFAPVADVLSDHRNPVLGMRCFSDDPGLAAAFTAAWIDGHHDASVGAVAKHFPGHGATPVDSHLDLPVVTRSLEELRATDLPPFVAAITHDVDCLMTSHVWYTALEPGSTPATLSPAAVALARSELGYDGVIVTDCLEMGAIQRQMPTGKAVVRALLAGADMVMVSHSIERQRDALQELTAAAASGALPRTRLLEANRRIHRLRLRLPTDGAPRTEEGAAVALEIARRGVTLIRDRDGLLPLRLGADGPLGVITFGSTEAVGIEGAVARTRLATEVSMYHAPIIDVPGDDPGESVQSIVDTLEPAETVLVGTAFAVGHTQQGEVVRALLQRGKRVVVLALHDPYDLLTFPQAPCYLATFGDSGPSLAAALEVVFGRRQPRGRLPVTIPGLYPRGYGLCTTGSVAP